MGNDFTQITRVIAPPGQAVVSKLRNPPTRKSRHRLDFNYYSESYVCFRASLSLRERVPRSGG